MSDPVSGTPKKFMFMVPMMEYSRKSQVAKLSPFQCDT